MDRCLVRQWDFGAKLPKRWSTAQHDGGELFCEVFPGERFPDVVRTDLANRPTEPMLVSLRARYTKLWGNRGFLQSGSRQTTPVRVGVTCGSGISVVRVGRK